MRIRNALLFAFVSAFCACAQAHNDPVARGRAVFASYDCKKCHMVAGVGGTLGPDLTFVGFRKDPEFLDTWLKAPGAWKADVSMPNFHFQPQVRADLVAYLATLKGDAYLSSPRRPWDAPEFAADPVKRGAEIYRRVGCISCHNKAGKGGYPNNNVVGGLVPALVNVSDGFTKEEVVKKVLEGVRHPVKQDAGGPEPLLYMPKWEEKLKKDEVEVVAEYLFSLKPKTSGGDSW
ncbi:MAG: c-type cytochrome [Elusimicrobia bacterium]|nr:c-type cytochrome [Elusimicrobiota bacterium]